MNLSTSDHGLQLTLLGGFDARLNGHPVAGIAYNKMRALLAYLAVERQQDHQREVLAELLWRGNDPTTARGNLRRTLSDLRRVLELPSNAVLFSVSKNTIRFIPNGAIDALDFMAPTPASPASDQASHGEDERIISLYRGEFLAGLSLPECPDFESWLQMQRETLHRRALALLEKLSNRHAQAGDYSKSLQFALRYTELEPWDEAACRLAMRLYVLNDQHNAAIAHYEACCRWLKNELGALPNDETRQLAEHIRSGKSASDLPDRAPEPVLQAIAPTPAQRRQVTVLYCELMLPAVDDPDEAMALLWTPQARCVQIIHQFSGYIVQTHGGGLLAYFGYPQAHEDAARHAVQAALNMTREAAYGIDIRTSVHTGLVITGGESAMPDTVGRTSRLAIQLRQCAGQNEVVISQETRCLVAGYFDCIGLGSQHFSDLAQTLDLYKVARESGARTRLEAAQQLTPLAGRQAELAQLIGLWKEAAQGTRHIALIQGEAGIGKSRLLHAMKEWLADQPHAIRELRCFPEFSQSPFHPLIEMLEASFDFEHEDAPKKKFGKMAQYLHAHYPVTAQQAMPLLARLLSLPLAERYPSPDFSPQKQKELTTHLLLTLLQTFALQQPVLLIVEDLHWIDPSSLELLTLFIEQQEPRTILAVLTARPDFDPPWDESLESTLTLAPLVEDDVAAMITSLRADMPAETIRRIVERADGVPLFVEEMAKMASRDQQASIPSTLHDLLAARMDSLGEAKYTAQLASTLGRAFDLELLRAVFPDGAAALADSLNALQEAGLISRISETSRQFKHALIQEAAYQSQTRAARQAAHQRIAQTLQSHFPQIVSTQPELLAQHLSAAGETRPSIDYWITAGQRAAHHSANTEAMKHFNTGLQLLMALAPSRERDQLEFALRVHLGATLVATRGYGSVEAAAEYTRAMELGEALGDRAGLFKAMWGVWLGSSSRVGHRHSLELAEKLLGLAEQEADPVQRQQAHYAMGNSLLWTGQLAQARSHQEQAMALYQPSHHDTMVRELGENICVASASHLVWVLWLMGFPDQARAAGEQMLALAHEINHPYSRCYAISYVMVLNHWLGEIETTGRLAQENMGLAHQHGFPLWLLSGLAFQGWTQAMQGQASGIAPLQQAVNTVRVAMNGVEAFFLAPLGAACLHLGQWEQALSASDAALVVVAAKNDRFLESEIFRVKGECLLAMPTPDTAAAEACFSQALAISHRQQAKSLELRAAMSLARLWQGQDKTEEARRVLEDVYTWFTEGFDTPDLQQARELLASLCDLTEVADARP